MSIPASSRALSCSVRIDKSEPRGGGFVNPPRATGPLSASSRASPDSRALSCSVRIDKSEPARGFANPPRATGPLSGPFPARFGLANPNQRGISRQIR
ncbi:hypothetical protein QUF80_10795 [Desulfococcaceae bacterium HSG8]|nr:hypothetical protein [Desulfococcaceae bacterium HSG8]